MSDEFNNINESTSPESVSGSSENTEDPENTTYSFKGTGTPEDISPIHSSGRSSGTSTSNSSWYSGSPAQSSGEQSSASAASSSTASASYTASAATEKKKREKKGASGTAKIIALVLVCALVGGLCGAGAALLVKGFGSAAKGSTTIYESNTPHSSVITAKVDSSTVLTDSEIYAANVNSTVGITTSITTNYFGYTTQAAASGSGFIITSDGYIVTNYHVVEDSDENSITVTLYNNSSYTAQLIGYDETTDVAVLKIDATDLTPVVIGDSDSLSIGDHVVAIGNPLGELTFSLTQGAVSALNREVTFSSGLKMALIQTDCAINSGNSGGALFNSYGEVIGITNAKYSGSSSSSEASVDNIGFAIPYNTVKNIVNSIIEKGYIEKPYIGISILSVSNSVQAYGLPAGASVQSITEGSPAEEAGLQENDIITAVDGNEITSSSDLSTYVSKTTPGDQIVLTVYRSGETMEITVTVGMNQQAAIPETAEDDSTSSQDNSQYSNGQSDQSWGNFFGGNGFGTTIPGIG